MILINQLTDLMLLIRHINWPLSLIRLNDEWTLICQINIQFMLYASYNQESVEWK